MSQATYAPDVNDNDRLIAALAYFVPVLVPIIILLVESMKVRPYQKYHALQSLGLSVAELLYALVICILVVACSFLVPIAATFTAGLGAITGCLVPCIALFWLLPFIPNIYYTIIAYTSRQYFEIPVITKFMMQQGWLTR